MENRHTGFWFRLLAWPLAGCAAIILPLLLRGLELPYAWYTPYPFEKQVFEFFGFAAGSLIILLALAEAHMARARTLRDWAPIVLPILVAFHGLMLLSDYPFKTPDYQAYELAAQNLISERNPYHGGYFYPPLLAQGLAAAYRATGGVSRILGCAPATPGQTWENLFYFYQCLQFYLYLTSYALTLRFARSLGRRKRYALYLVTALFLVNTPLDRTLGFNQVNLWVYNAALLGILLLHTRPVAGGLAVALGAHLKLYPALLVLPWILTRRWRVVAAVILGTAGLLVIETHGLRDFTTWKQFTDYFGHYETGRALRDNSLHSVVFNTTLILKHQVPIVGNVLHPAVAPMVYLLDTLVVLIFGMRFVSRQRRYAGVPRNSDPDRMRMAGHAMDALAAMLLLSPMVWEHHFVLALPLCIWAIVTQGSRKPVTIGLATALIFLVPAFDLYPFSYSRLLGLCMLLRCTAPRHYEAEETLPDLPEETGKPPKERPVAP